MQKTSKKASILIWSTFLSLVITVTFISISTSINKNLKNNAGITEQFNTQKEIQNIINSGSINQDFQSQYLENGEKIIFDNSNKIEVSINKGLTHTGRINTPSSISIKIIQGGPVFYEDSSSSGLINDSDTFAISSPEYFTVKNLGAYTKILITSDSTENYLSKYKKYTIYKKIGNKEVIKSTGKIKNF